MSETNLVVTTEVERVVVGNGDSSVIVQSVENTKSITTTEVEKIIIDPEKYQLIIQDQSGPKGDKGDSGDTLFTKVLDSVNANETKIIDTLPLIDFKMIEYTLRTSNQPNSKTKGLKMIVVKTDSSINDQVYAKIGDAINFSLNAVINGSSMNLILQNNENFVLNLALIRASL